MADPGFLRAIRANPNGGREKILFSHCFTKTGPRISQTRGPTYYSGLFSTKPACFHFLVSTTPCETIPLADPGAPGTCGPSGSKLFHFHAFFGKKIILLWELTPPQENPGTLTSQRWMNFKICLIQLSKSFHLMVHYEFNSRLISVTRSVTRLAATREH